MNSIFNEHPLRRINEEFIFKSLEEAQKDQVIQTIFKLIKSLLYETIYLLWFFFSFFLNQA
jgi:hypothetical protein